MYYSTKRQQFLVDQGYAYHVVTNLLEGGQQEGLRFSSTNEQINLLTQVRAPGGPPAALLPCCPAALLRAPAAAPLLPAPSRPAAARC